MINVLSIFSGGGGIDIGFKNAGFNVFYSTDIWDIGCRTIKSNYPKQLVVCDDIRNIDYGKVLKSTNIIQVDCLVGGPPCPAYSKSRFYLKDKKRALEDENSFTLYEYIRAVKELKPKVFFFENVNGFVFKPHKDAFDLLVNETEKLGYELTYKVLNAADYGVPQIRKRFICVGVRRDINKSFKFPSPTHFDHTKSESDGLLKWVTAGDVISDIDFDLPEDHLKKAGSKHHELLKQIPPGDNYLYFTSERGHPEPKFKWRSRYWSFLLKLSPEKPSWTIQASFSNNMGPFHWKNRFLRISEIKRLQTFPDEYILEGDFLEQWRQIGNAVPPLLVEVIAKEIRTQIFGGE